MVTLAMLTLPRNRSRSVLSAQRRCFGAVHASAFCWRFRHGADVWRGSCVPFFITPFLHLGDRTIRTTRLDAATHPRSALASQQKPTASSCKRRANAMRPGPRRARDEGHLAGTWRRPMECTGGVLNEATLGPAGRRVCRQHLANNSFERHERSTRGSRTVVATGAADPCCSLGRRCRTSCLTKRSNRAVDFLRVRPSSRPSQRSRETRYLCQHRSIRVAQSIRFFRPGVARSVGQWRSQRGISCRWNCGCGPS